MKIFFKRQGDSNIICLRHDVDRFPYNALKMARLEYSLGVKSVYYFRNCTFNESIIKEISNMGHEIGYHYEVFSEAKNDATKAVLIFKQSLEKFRALAEVKTACMHGSPLSKVSNLEIWKHATLKDFDLIAEPYISIDYSNIYYFTDTGRSFAGSSYNLGYKVQNGIKPEVMPSSTEDLISLLALGQIKRLIIQTHPERWSYSFISHLRSIMLDFAAHSIKKIIKLIR